MKFLLEFLQPLMNSSKLVRVGAKGDGGYVVPKAIFSRDALNLVTLGVGYEFSFERDLLARDKPVTILMYDYSCGAVGTIERVCHLLGSLSILRAVKIFVHYINWTIFRIYNHKHITFVAKYVSSEPGQNFTNFRGVMAEWKKLKQSGVSILKVDIERGEYSLLTTQVIEEISTNFDVLVMELHGVEDFHQEIETIHRDLEEKGFFVCHIHHNNYTHYIPNQKLTNCFEISYCSRKLEVPEMQHENSFPKEGLDFPCNRKKKDIPWSI